jgi:hypothetical protein
LLVPGEYGNKRNLVAERRLSFHPLASMMEVVGILIEKYEDGHVPELAVF